MLKSELIEQLNEIDGDFEVFLQVDDEGNGYRRVYGVDVESYYMEGRHPEFVSSEDVEEGHYDGETLHEGVLLW